MACCKLSIGVILMLIEALHFSRRFTSVCRTFNIDICWQTDSETSSFQLLLPSQGLERCILMTAIFFGEWELQQMLGSSTSCFLLPVETQQMTCSKHNVAACAHCNVCHGVLLHMIGVHVGAVLTARDSHRLPCLFSFGNSNAYCSSLKAPL